MEERLLRGKIVHTMPWTAQATCPWPSDYERVVIPYTDREKVHSNNGGLGHVQIVRKDNLRKIHKELKY